MIADEKRQIIMDEGVPVEVSDHVGSVLYNTNALVGKATKQSSTELSLEYHRKGHFLPGLDIDNGLLVKNLVSNEIYLIIANMIETYGSEVITKIARMLETNASITVTGFVETADENGDIFRGETVKVADLPVHIVYLNSELKQYQPGLHPNAEYLVYCSAIDFDLLDKVVIQKGSRDLNVKVEHLDYFTFEGVVMLSVSSETRK